jgi:hypothetical protein
MIALKGNAEATRIFALLRADTALFSFLAMTFKVVNWRVSAPASCPNQRVAAHRG